MRFFGLLHNREVATYEGLSRLLEEVLELLSRPNNDFAYSSWEDAEDARGEVQGLSDAAREGRMTSLATVATLFLPTGPLQELAISSGWGDAFLDLADRFDALGPCTCELDASATLETVSVLGTDKDWAEVSVRRCPRCGQTWMHRLTEDEAFMASGRWAKWPVADPLTSADDAASSLATAPWHFFGGSSLGGRTGRTRTASM